MRLVRVKRLLITIATMLSLAASAVSACACSHHGDVLKDAENTCHGQSHDTSAVKASSDARQFGSGCECFARTSIPAITAKKDDSRTTADKQIADIAELPTPITPGSENVAARDAILLSLYSNYQQALLESLPPRAPPRL